MKLVQHARPKEFYDRAASLLLTNEAENHLMLGIVLSLLTSPGPPPSGLYLATVEDNKRPVAAAVMVPSNKLVVTRAADAALQLIAADLSKSKILPPAVVGPSKSASDLADIFSALAGTRCERGRFMLIYQLDRVEKFGGSTGKLRPAKMEDLDQLVQWGKQFVEDTQISESAEKIGGQILAMVREGRVFVWDDGHPVAMAAYTGQTPNGVRIHYVYTPPDFRRKGYGTSCVSTLSQKLLNEGKKFCFLFADLASPVSNSIYQRIGYNPVCEFREYRLQAGSPG